MVPKLGMQMINVSSSLARRGALNIDHKYHIEEKNSSMCNHFRKKKSTSNYYFLPTDFMLLLSYVQSIHDSMYGHLIHAYSFQL